MPVIIQWSRRGGGSGSATPPDSPTITVADNADGTGGVVTITGSTVGATNTVYSQAVDGDLGTAAWVDQGDRTGNGVVAVDPGDGYYWWQVISSNANGTAASNLVYQPMTDGANSIHYRCLLAVQSRIQVLSLAGVANDSVRIQPFPIPRDFGTGLTYSLPCVLVSPYGNERADEGQGTNIRDDFGYPIPVAMIAANNHSLAVENAKLKWREQIIRAFQNQRLPGVAESIRSIVEPGPVVVPADWTKQYWASSVTIRCICRATRGLT